MSRTALVEVDGRLLSSYGAAGTSHTLPRDALRPLRALRAGRATADTAEALYALHEAVSAAGGDLRITDLWRSVATQQEARERYERWIFAGRPKPGSSGFDSRTMKADLVAKPGRSYHNAGRAIDVHLAALRFPGVAADRQLDALWELARPIGWTPILRSPEERVSEAWHFDYFGPWARVRARVGYEQGAIAAAADVGNGEPVPAYQVQGGLHRAGYSVGEIDGDIGPKTRAGLRASGYTGPFTDTPAMVAHVDALPDAEVYFFSAA